ncbi:F-box family protein [Rhynchospora pubera]|uniref:F-box family protein n=1 Tax=Rhynchospora pubera TaxID=906938 RepID=A0AAV8HUD4_9POAL|nr:F-box family protein [Rhynchospora pubera]
MEHLPKVRNGAVAKRMKKKAKRQTLLNMLPEDAIVEIVSQLVSSSPQPFADLYSLKSSCKAFFEASKDKMVKQRIALERDIFGLTWMATDDECMSVLKSCWDAGNAEANFMLALINIFKKGDIKRGAEFLKKASSSDHKAALYMLNILCVRLQKHNPFAEGNSHTLKVDQRIFDDYDQLKWCREKVLNAIRLVTWNNWQDNAVANVRQCNNSNCGIRGWDCRCFCSKDCEWNHEYYEFCKAT